MKNIISCNLNWKGIVAGERKGRGLVKAGGPGVSADGAPGTMVDVRDVAWYLSRENERR